MEPALQKASQALQFGDLATAERLCRNLLAANPAHASALQIFGIVQRRLGHLEEAETLFRRSIEIAPGNPEYRTNLAQLLRARGQFAASVEEFRRAMAIAPDFRPARLGLARTAGHAGNHGLAEEQARALISVNANDSEAWSALGSALYAQQRADEALDALRRAVSISPNYAAARQNLAAILSSEDHSEEALAQVAECDRLGNHVRSLELTRARALMQLDRYDEAESVLVRLIAAAPDDSESQFMLAQLRHVRGDTDFARELRTAANRPGAPAGTRARYADTLRRAGQMAAAEDILRELIAAEGPLPQLLSSLATVLHEAGRLLEAVAAARQATKTRPDDATSAENLVAALLSAGEPGEALPIIERFHRVAPDDQRWITYRADVARQRREELHADWYDLDRLVRVYQLEPPPGYATIEEFHAELRPLLEQRHRQAAHPLDQSLRGGTQTSRGLLADPHPLIRKYLSLLDAPLADYQSAIGHDPRHPMRSRNAGAAIPTGCWSVRLKRGGFHVNHIHPQGWISSAYYVSVPAEVADEDVRSGWIKFGEPRFPMPEGEPLKMVQPKPGRLVLFPSYMWHGTNPLLGDEPRLTIAFDALPRKTRAT